MSFATETRERTRPVLPLAAMVDILFLLLIFFMTASVFRDQEMRMDINLPASETAQTPGAQAAEILVSFDSDGRVYVGQREVSLAQLRDVLTDLAEVTEGETVRVRGDVEGPWGLGIRIVDIAYAAGIENVDANTVEPLDE